MWEWVEPCCRGVLDGEGVMETVGMGGESGMEEEEEVDEERGPREAGATPVGAGFPPDDRLRFTACEERDSISMYMQH